MNLGIRREFSTIPKDPPRSVTFYLWHALHNRGEQDPSPFRWLDNDARWMKDAACADSEPEAWFPRRSLDHNNKTAARICRTSCPVREECLAYALAHHLEGIWGGTTDHERATLRRPNNTRRTHP